MGDIDGAEATGFDDAEWKPVTLPYAWNEDEAFAKEIFDWSVDRNENPAGGQGGLSTGVAWYRKQFSLPEGSENKKVFIEFQGVRHIGDVWVNSKHVGYEDNGVMAFGFDITDQINPPGETNVIAVRTDSSWDVRERETNTPFQWNDRNFNANYGGINKNVVLHVTDRLYQTLPLYSKLGTTGTYVYADDFDIAGRSATITAETEVRNEHDRPQTFEYLVTIHDADDQQVARFEGGEHTLQPGQTAVVRAAGRAESLNFWSWGYGYLYDVDTTLIVDGEPVDTVTTRTGFRKTGFANGYVTLNDRPIQLKGYAQRTTNEWPAVGVDIPPWVSDFSNALMLESNGNFVRWMHVTPSKQDVESCDRVGLMQAMPAGDAERDPSGRRWEMRVELMRDAIIYHRNNPSIIMYEAGNDTVSEAHMQEMIDVRNAFDPRGGRAMGSREMLDSEVAEWGGEMLYINKSAGKPMWATEYSRDEGLRRYADEHTPPFHREGDGPLYKGRSARSYNHNQDEHAIENVRRWYDYWRERPGTGTRVSAGGTNIIFSDTNTHHRGEANYRTSGEVDPVRLPKAGFFAHQVMWDGWVDVERPRTHIIGHWNYAIDTVKDIHVVSSAPRVELFINGELIGDADDHRCHFLHTFNDVNWEPGTLRAVGFDAEGIAVSEHVIETAGKATAIRLTPRTGPGGMRADGADLMLVDVEVVDADGRRVSTAFNEVHFKLEGPAEWRGGIALGPNNYILSQTLPVELGVNRVLVRSTTDAGTLTLSAEADGLESDSIEVATLPFEVVGGLADARPADGLPPRLDRGPTPSTDSIMPTRRPIQIASARAGASESRATHAFDDDETTAWSNEGDVQNGWITLHLPEASTVNALTMRLGRFRDRTYPIRVLVDDHVVFTGETDRSLGYVTIPFEPTRGEQVTVELSGRTRSGDAFDEITELEDQNQTDTGGRGGASTLEIVELEVYGPLHQD